MHTGPEILLPCLYSVHSLLPPLVTAQLDEKLKRCITACSEPAVLVQAEAGEPVAIYGEGKEHAMAIGITKMSTKEMREINKGHGVDVVHYLNDGLWKNQQFA